MAVNDHRVFVVVSRMGYHNSWAGQVGRAIRQCFETFGFPAWLVCTNSLPKTAENDLLVYLVNKLPPSHVGTPGHKVYWNFHPCVPERAHGYSGYYHKHWVETEKSLRRGHFCAVLEYDKVQYQFMERAKWPVWHCPVGYHKSFEVAPSEPLPRGIYFLGNLSTKRRHWIDIVGAKTVNYTTTPWVQNRLLCTPGVHINVKLRTMGCFLGLRVIMLLASNARCIVTENSGWSPLKRGKHCFEATKPEKMKRICADLMRHPEECEKIGRQGYEFVKTHLRLEASLVPVIREVLGVTL